MGTTQLHLRLNDDPLPERPPEPVKPEPQPARQPAAGYTIVPDSILCRTDLSQGEKLMLCRICRWMGVPDGKRPSVATLAGNLGVGKDQARRYIHNLEVKGFILTKKRNGVKNLYEPVADVPPVADMPPVANLLPVDDVPPAANMPPGKPRNRQKPVANKRPSSRETEIKTETKKSATAPAVVFPESLDCAEFKARWEEYLAYRGDRRLPKLLPASVNKQLGQLASYPLPVVMAAIDKTIASGWQGIFPDKARMPSTAVAPVAGKYDHLN